MSPIRADVTVIGRRLDPEHHRLRDLLTRIAQPHEWHEADTPDARALLARHGLAEPDLPVVLEGEVALGRMSVPALAGAWSMTEPPSRAAYDLAIIGAGPAGLAAAVYAASDGLETVVIERDVPGGQASHTSLIENFIGFPEGIGGAELARLAGRQAERFGAEMVLLRGVTGGARDAGGFHFELDGGHAVTSRVVIAAPGMEWRRLELPGLDELLGRGVYYGAGRSEARQCRGDEVVVVGAGNSAGQAALNLAGAAARVTMVVRGDGLAKSMSAYLVDRIAEHPRIDVRTGTEVTAVHADGTSLAAVTATERSGGSERLPAAALFVCIGGVPRTGWAEATGVRTGPGGFVLTGPDLLDGGERPDGWPLDRDPLALETSVPGLFAAGDVRHGSTKRVGGAAGEGAMAVALAHRRLDELAAAGAR